jgi:hypothetical protein
VPFKVVTKTPLHVKLLTFSCPAWCPLHKRTVMGKRKAALLGGSAAFLYLTSD